MSNSRRIKRICGSLLIVLMMAGSVCAPWDSAIHASDEFEIIKAETDGSSHSSEWRFSGWIETADRLDGSPAMDNQWDLLFTSEAGTTCNDEELYGIVYAGGFFFISGGNNGMTPNKVYVLNPDGTYFGDFDQWSASSAGWKGLTYDGTYLYGCEENVISAFDLTGNPVPSMDITIPMYGLQGITYDPSTDHFWAVAAGELYEVDREGNATYMLIPYIGATGLAFDDAAPDGPWLWIFCNLGPVQTLIKQFDPVNQNLTGVVYELPLLAGSTSQTSSDLFFSSDYDSDLFVLGGITDADPVDQIFVLEMYPQEPTSGISVMLTYQSGSPVPATGGSLNFNIAVTNNNPSPVTFDIWTMATLPNGSEYGPIINVQDFTAPANWSGDRDRIQAVPGGAPAGMYTYDAYVGVYPGDIWGEDHFDFEKLAGGDGGAYVSGWACWGTEFGRPTTETPVITPNHFALHGAHPNPFNPMTTLSFSLPEASLVKLTVYDINGRQVAELIGGWREAGSHEVTFDGSGLSSGLYICRLQAGQFRAGGRMVLVK